MLKPGRLVLVASLWLTAALPFRTIGQPGSNAAPTEAEERAECIKNLKTIYGAIQAYEEDHKDLPNWLSDLVPKYLPDANVLVCPVCRRTGKTEQPALADPKLPSSYLFEFNPLPLGPAHPNRTRRDWKRRQMSLLGSNVPVVRCRFHHPVLNLSFDGRIYDSPSMWELAFTNRVNAAELTEAHLFADDSPSTRPPAHATGGRHFTARDPKTSPELIDLTTFYNAMLTETWHGRGGNGNDLSALPEGVQTFGGQQFDVRGIVQLKGKADSVTNFPAEVRGIKVHQKCRHLYFLHSAGVGRPADEGKQVGTYVVHYASQQMRVDIPIIYGQAMRDWHTSANEGALGDTLKVVWKGQNAVSTRAGQSIRLFMTTWTNPVPDFEVESLDLEGNMANPGPFIIAVTAD